MTARLRGPAPRNVNVLLVAKREIRIEAPSIQYRQHVELGRQIGVVTVGYRRAPLPFRFVYWMWTGDDRHLLLLVELKVRDVKRSVC